MDKQDLSAEQVWENADTQGHKLYSMSHTAFILYSYQYLLWHNGSVTAEKIRLPTNDLRWEDENNCIGFAIWGDIPTTKNGKSSELYFCLKPATHCLVGNASPLHWISKFFSMYVDIFIVVFFLYMKSQWICPDPTISQLNISTLSTPESDLWNF